jgi:hypothetical protein
VPMPKRQFRIVPSDTTGILAVCEFCDRQFKSRSSNLMEAGQDVKAQFDDHTCKHEDVNQAAARVVREATKD